MKSLTSSPNVQQVLQSIPPHDNHPKPLLRSRKSLSITTLVRPHNTRYYNSISVSLPASLPAGMYVWLCLCELFGVAKDRWENRVFRCFDGEEEFLKRLSNAHPLNPVTHFQLTTFSAPLRILFLLHLHFIVSKTLFRCP